VARLLCIAAMRIMRKSFATNSAGHTHGRSGKSDEPVSDAINARSWDLIDHRYLATVRNEDLLKNIKHFGAAVGKYLPMIAF
jgi:hypothetical protein